MFLITVMQTIENRELIPGSFPEHKLHAASLKELGDWCHAFIRACATAGWRKEEFRDRMQEMFLMPGPARLDLLKAGLAPLITLRREGTPKIITIEIEALEPKTPFEAAKLFTR